MNFKYNNCKTALSLLVLMGTFFVQAQKKPNFVVDKAKMEWFKDAKLGIFIHWGIYAVNGIAESWSFHNGQISHKDYMKQLKGFTAAKYDPKQWVQYIRESGAKYTVLTTKHHDGVALWDTKQGKLSVVKKTPAKRDLITPFVEAVRAVDLKLGLYYSLIDWTHKDHPNFLRNKKRYKDDPKRWAKFMKFNIAQLKEVQRTFNPDLYWFDGDWEQPAEKWDALGIRKMLLDYNPKAIINSRLRGYGDYATPEQGVPVLKPKADAWELCLTMNTSWGYQHRDKDYKTVNQLIRIFVDCISMGGNLLLDIGPKADGTIPEEQIAILKGIGRWTKKHQEAIYGTRAGIAKAHFVGYSTLSKDKKTLYLYFDNHPTGSLVVKGLYNKVKRARVVGMDREVAHKVVGKLSWRDIPGLLYVDVPNFLQDEDVTVVALEFDEPIRLFTEEVKAIESN